MLSKKFYKVIRHPSYSFKNTLHFFEEQRDADKR